MKLNALRNHLQASALVAANLDRMNQNILPSNALPSNRQLSTNFSLGLSSNASNQSITTSDVSKTQFQPPPPTSLQSCISKNTDSTSEIEELTESKKSLLEVK